MLLGRLSLSHATAFSEHIPHNGYDAVGNLLAASTTDSLGTATKPL